MFAIDQTKTDKRSENLDGGIFLLVVTGLRYYTPRLGRWASRDPIGEDGGSALYTACGNRLVCDTDYLGLSPLLPLPIIEPITEMSSLAAELLSCWNRRQEANRLRKEVAERVAQESKEYICCPPGCDSTGVPMHHWPDWSDRSVTGFGVTHEVYGCALREAGFSPLCMMLANLRYEQSTFWTNWRLQGRTLRGLMNWARDTGGDMGFVVGGYESGGPCTVERFRPAECVSKSERPCGCEKSAGAVQ